MTAAERMARLRQRQKAGLVAVTIGKQRYEVTEETAELLRQILAPIAEKEEKK